MKLAAGLMLVGAMWSCKLLAAVPEPSVKAPQAAAPEARLSKPVQKQKTKPADKVERKVEEAPGATAVTPEVTEESVQLKGVRG
jgi:hypothetical protein